ncbi:Serpentine receptor class gamma [Meloidogyne graminicola]|uniref:Serpentine receptor class gamma n=1 Tax=Meloidogyne graminicola TaxID=189291 RepID=A0A8S9ZGL2_9BILA|nr:Serpentine receptor class gamma [Meloidogyne graminicola]
MNKTWIFNFFNSLSQYTLLPTIFDLIILIPSLFLYLIELILILLYKKTFFKSSFFKLFVARTISSIFELIFQFFYLRFGRFGFFLSFYLALPNIYLNFIYLFFVYFIYVECLLTTTLLLNRLTSLIWPLKYEKLWKKLWYLIIIIILIIPLPLSCNILFLNIFILLHSNDSSFTLYAPDDTNTLFITCLFSIFISIFCFIINIGCLYVYKKKTIVNIAQTENKQKMENKLTIYSILTFLGQFLNSIYLIILYFVGYQLVNFGINTELIDVIFITVFNQNSWVNDINTITIPAFLLFWASEKIRNNVYKIIKINNQKINNKTIMVIPKQQTFTTQMVVIERKIFNKRK